MLNVGVLVSGGGSNLQAIIDRSEAGGMPDARIAVVVSSNPAAYALERARNHGIATEVVDFKSFAARADFDAAVIRALHAYKVDLVVLGGFNYIMGDEFNRQFEGRVINVHPSLIPAFCGKGFYGLTPHIKALEYGVKLTGATVHFVEKDCDAGPIILQKAIPVDPDDTPETLQKRVMVECEHILLPEAIRLISENKVKLDGRKVKITE